MTDPNQPYGAVPPPAFPPPPGPPPGPPPPPPGFGGPGFGGPGQPGKSGTSGKGIWITLVVVGVLALVGLIVGLILLLTSDDQGDDEGSDKDGGKTSQASGADPDDVVEDLIDAAEEGNCDAATAFLTEAAKAADPCQSDEFQLLSSDDVDAEVGDATVDGDTATVPVTFSSPAGTSDYVFTLEQVDGAWLVASYDDDHADAPTDGASSDAPSDASTSPGGGPAAGGTSTADAVPNQPEAVVEAFLDSFVSGDCATAEDLVTAEYIEEEGECDAGQIPSDFADQVTYEVGKATVKDAAGTATVPVEAEFGGSKESSTVKLVKVGGLWRVNEFD
ncbi:DUF4878 domain-containing protein [Nocardioides sp. WS12]|uniref:DUF4878 domain-containing protein n=1 Tax=Nocardioides sp. WS12 TaxID=2486272 RepID=UPI0015F8C9EB|nr:DUF4878 domain-containing protein [Nocardioides sp. WS12]